jgi:hypothetical protein
VPRGRSQRALSTSKEILSARTSRYEGYLDEVREWRELPSGAITLAAPVPLEGKVVQKGRVAKRKAAAQPAEGQRAGGREDAAAADGAPPASSRGAHRSSAD